MKHLLLAILLVLPVAIVPVVRANLIVNGSFETGSHDGWTFAPAETGSYFIVTPTLTSFGYAAQQGDYAAGFGAIEDSMDNIYQSFSTIAGRSYDLAFWLHNSAGWSGSTLVAKWDSVVLSGNGNPFLPVTASDESFDWTAYAFNVLATTSETTIMFSGVSNAEWIMIDNVSVVEQILPASTSTLKIAAVSVPDSGTTILLLTAGLGVLALGFKNRGLVT